jgi:DNA-binding GntR family transcriptional regulator
MEVLEGLAFRFAAEKAEESDLEQLDRLVQQMEQACQDGNADRWSDLNGEFHIKVADISQLELLARFTRTTFDYWGRLRRFYLTEIVEDILAAQAEHHTMVKLLRERRVQELADLVVPHNRRSRDYFLRVMPPKAS